MRNYSHLLLLSMCLTIVFIVLNMKSSTELLEPASIAGKRSFRKQQEESRADYRWIAHNKTPRYVTPSLAELGNIPYKYKHILMLTRIPGTGAELIVLILQRLQGYNAFKHIRLPPGDHGFLSTLQQDLLVEEISNIVKQEAIPLTFDGDVKFLNFSKFGRQGPTFISLVRDPLDPRIWQKYEKGEEGMLYRGAIPHFCGQEPRCMEPNDTWALEQAKANVVRWYPVVGILDYMEETLNVLAVEFPYFFKGAIRIYDQFRPKEKYLFASSVTLNPLVIEDMLLRKVLAQEVEFYEWLKFRLLNRTFHNDRVVP
ncbi:uronyl 2-sulfotransferase-like [Linepithema humile]|uniref:uronyl 2-sulfotransferase-like n=1 Tax=Linepithema humile TaxID=83485 RepID=UPI00062398A0|nr:PREDICTED: uronyl 2-sulfotransferase-like [Linepithema humile]